MHRIILFLTMPLVLVLPGFVSAQDLAEGTIEGQVINGTEGGGSVAGVEVTLITYSNDMIAGTRTAETDSEGKFQFDNIAIENEYLVSASYMEVDYYYPVVFDPGETAAYVEVGVCDATTSDEAIRVGLSHAIISFEEEGIKVTVVFWLVNDGDRTYVGTDGVLVFTLPEEAYVFEAPQELMLDFQLLGNNRVTYLVPFPPGERQLVYSYSLAEPDSNELSIPLEIDYPTDSFELMVGGEGIEVAVSQLAPAEPVFTATDERFIHFRGENLARGTIINVHLSNLSDGGGTFLVILWVIIAVVIIGLAVYLLNRRRKNAGE
jgi:hypothetical protein